MKPKQRGSCNNSFAPPPVQDYTRHRRGLIVTQEHGEQQQQGALDKAIRLFTLLLLGVGLVTGGIGVSRLVSVSLHHQQTQAAWDKLNDPTRKQLLAQEAEQTERAYALQDLQIRLAVQLAALTDKKRHLRLDTSKELLYLVEESCILRELPVEIGEAAPSEWVQYSELTGWLPPQDRSWPAPGNHRLWGRVGRGIFLQHITVALLESPWPDGRTIPENLSAALVLEDGTRLYSEYAVPVLPPVRTGAIRVPHKELNSVLSLLEETPVYVW